MAQGAGSGWVGGVMGLQVVVSPALAVGSGSVLRVVSHGSTGELVWIFIVGYMGHIRISTTARVTQYRMAVIRMALSGFCMVRSWRGLF